MKVEDRVVEAGNLITDRSGLNGLRVYVIGDFGSGDVWQAKVAEAMLSLAKTQPPDFILSTGDCVYSDEEEFNSTDSAACILRDRFDSYYRGLATDFFQCPGNHDLIEVFGGEPAAMMEHSFHSPVWRMPALSYRIPKLPPWLAIHVMNSNVFGHDGYIAERALYSEQAMERELRSIAETFSKFGGLKLLVGHHPVFTPGKRTYRYGGKGELPYMHRVRKIIECLGIHFYLSGHEHHQSHTSGPACEHIIQGCGGAKPNRRHGRRMNGDRLDDKVFRFMAVMNGFAVLDMDAQFKIRLRFFGIPLDRRADDVRVIYEKCWSDPGEIGDRSLGSAEGE